jgi:predicted transcriptional regulator
MGTIVLKEELRQRLDQHAERPKRELSAALEDAVRMSCASRTGQRSGVLSVE